MKRTLVSNRFACVIFVSRNCLFQFSKQTRQNKGKKSKYVSDVIQSTLFSHVAYNVKAKL